MVQAAGLGTGGGWVMRPPVCREAAEAEFGAVIPEVVWRKICGSFFKHGRRLDDWNEATRLNESPNDPKGWQRLKGDTERRLDKALKALGGINRDFLREAETNVSIVKSGGLTSYNGVARLDTAMDEILFLMWIIREAESIMQEMPSKAESHRMLARDVFAALKPCGATLSNGWKVAQTQPSNADLTGFERLAELLKIHQGDTPAATSKWLREAVGTK